MCVLNVYLQSRVQAVQLPVVALLHHLQLLLLGLYLPLPLLHLPLQVLNLREHTALHTSVTDMCVCYPITILIIDFGPFACQKLDVSGQILFVVCILAHRSS